MIDGSLELVARANRRLDESSHYSYGVAVPDTSTGARYRAITWFKSDGDHAAAPSPEVYFTFQG